MGGAEVCPVTRPRLWYEPFAGSGAVALALLGGSRCRPPITYMGAKRALAGQILAAMGLRPRQGADAVLLVDAGPWGWAWKGLMDPATRVEVAAVLRSWRGEDPVELWRGLAVVGGEVVLVADGDSLLCACSRTDAAVARCHRAWAAPFLARAGWRVVLDGAEVAR